jgi:hypothetical protein
MLSTARLLLRNCHEIASDQAVNEDWNKISQEMRIRDEAATSCLATTDSVLCMWRRLQLSFGRSVPAHPLHAGGGHESSSAHNSRGRWQWPGRDVIAFLLDELQSPNVFHFVQASAAMMLRCKIYAAQLRIVFWASDEMGESVTPADY